MSGSYFTGDIVANLGEAQHNLALVPIKSNVWAFYQRQCDGVYRLTHPEGNWIFVDPTRSKAIGYNVCDGEVQIFKLTQLSYFQNWHHSRSLFANNSWWVGNWGARYRQPTTLDLPYTPYAPSSCPAPVSTTLAIGPGPTSTPQTVPTTMVQPTSTVEPTTQTSTAQPAQAVTGQQPYTLSGLFNNISASMAAMLPTAVPATPAIASTYVPSSKEEKIVAQIDNNVCYLRVKHNRVYIKTKDINADLSRDQTLTVYDMYLNPYQLTVVNRKGKNYEVRVVGNDDRDNFDLCLGNDRNLYVSQ
jgi:hypothetical protein